MMNLTNVQNSITRSFHRVGYQLKKHSPEIMVVTGVIGTVASTVMACKATTKLESVLAETKENVGKVHEVLADPNVKEEVYSPEDAKKDIAIFYAKGAFEVVKLYAPSVILGGLSIASILTSHNIMRKRNVALAAAYSVVDKGFKEYRGRVVERFGEALDRELKYNVKVEEVKETVVDEETGKKKTVKSTIEVADPNEYSDYARFFDDGCLGWEKDAEMNLFYLRRQQDFANELFKAKGYMFLNDVYDMLGIPRTRAGQAVGWIYEPNNPDHKGDNFIDFGIYDMHRRANRDFVNGIERVILLDFNVDGPIDHIIAPI